MDRELVLRIWKDLADKLISENKFAYVKDVQGNIYFADIILSGEDLLVLDCFGPDQRAGKRETIRWITVVSFDEFKGSRK